MPSSKYTFCDEEKEKQIKYILLELAYNLKTHYHFEKAELFYQNKQAQVLWDLIEQYRVLEWGAPDVLLYPDEATDRMKCELKQNIYSHIIKIRNSNKKIKDSLEYLQPMFMSLDDMANRIDWTVNSALVKGDCEFKPLRNYVETVADLRHDFEKRVIDRQVIQDMFNVQHGIAIEIYQDLLEQQSEFNDEFAKAIVFTDLIN